MSMDYREIMGVLIVAIPAVIVIMIMGSLQRIAQWRINRKLNRSEET